MLIYQTGETELSFISKSFSAVGKLVVVVMILGAFLVGMAGVVYMSLSGAEIKVPEIVGKDFVESERELASLGLKIKKRADRTSTEKMNTVLEQLPKPGETVKTGQLILVVVSKAGLQGEDVPASLKKDIDSDDTEKIEEMISDKPKKSKANTNTNKKKADTTRDVIANTSISTSNSSDSTSTGTSDSNKKDKAKDPGSDKTDKNDPSSPRPQNTPGPNKPSSLKPAVSNPRQKPPARQP